MAVAFEGHSQVDNADSFTEVTVPYATPDFRNGSSGNKRRAVSPFQEVTASFATPDDPGLAGKGELGNGLAASQMLYH